METSEDDQQARTEARLPNEHEVWAKSTYEVFVDIRHHERHLEDSEGKIGQCWKLVDTGKPKEMLANCLRELADEIEEGKFDSHRRSNS